MIPAQENELFGLRVVAHPLAYRTEVTYEIRPWPIKKRRRNWYVHRAEKRVPVAIITPSAMYVDEGTYKQLGMITNFV